MKLQIPLFLLVFLTLALIPNVYAADTIHHNLLDIPQGIATTLGISVFAAGLLVSIVLLMVCVLPFVILTMRSRGNGVMIATLIVGMSVLGFCVAVAWFPIWFFAVLIVLVGLMFGAKIKDMI